LVAGSNPARGANKNKDLSQIADRLRTLENSFWQQPWQRRADFGGGAYIKRVMLPHRSRSSRGRPLNAPAAFIHPCQPTVASRRMSLLHSRVADDRAIALGFDLLMRDGDDLRRKPLIERKTALGKLLLRSRGGIQYVEYAEGHGHKLYEAACKLGLEGIVSKKLTSSYRSGPTKSWIKVKNPKAPAATRAADGTF